MRVRIGSSVWLGPAVDLRAAELAVSGQQVAKAVHRSEAIGEISVQCTPPDAFGRELIHIHSDRSISKSRLLALAARSRGLRAPQDEQRLEIERQLREEPPRSVDTAPLRERIATLGEEITELRERVMRLQGALSAMRTGDSEDEQRVRSTLSETVRRLSELETEREAVRQQLEQARTTNRRRRDEHDERLRLEDNAANLRRAANEWLTSRMSGAYARALHTAPDVASRTVRVALAIVRVGECASPVVIEADAFDSSMAARNWLDTPVIQL
ncbi:DUF7856 family protein [Halocatena halophila]|uniref:DUF7856 family protein n=1 Tax=Halocatena halophila TaxID=2814576 RepID=UPI002ED21D93